MKNVKIKLSAAIFLYYYQEQKSFDTFVIFLGNIVLRLLSAVFSSFFRRGLLIVEMSASNFCYAAQVDCGKTYLSGISYVGGFTVYWQGVRVTRPSYYHLCWHWISKWFFSNLCKYMDSSSFQCLEIEKTRFERLNLNI